MRQLRLTQLLKTGAAFAAVSALAADSGLLLLDRTGLLTVPAGWYLNVPLTAWTAVGLSAGIRLAGRLLHQIAPRPGRITAHHDEAPPLRPIPFTARGRRGTLFANVSRTIFSPALSAPDSRPTAWTVPVDDTPVIVRETDLLAFLLTAARRDRHQFSRRYWTRQHRPRLDRLTYEAYLRLLLANNLISGRHEQGGASGRLVTRPRAALAWLKHDSPYRL